MTSSFVTFGNFAAILVLIRTERCLESFVISHEKL